jgi:hypothetical protein
MIKLVHHGDPRFRQRRRTVSDLAAFDAAFALAIGPCAHAVITKPERQKEVSYGELRSRPRREAGRSLSEHCIVTGCQHARFPQGRAQRAPRHQREVPLPRLATTPHRTYPLS